jgi:hypothetical protein
MTTGDFADASPEEQSTPEEPPPPLPPAPPGPEGKPVTMPLQSRPVVPLRDGTIGKTRNPWGVFLLCLIPFYWFFWYYFINRELRDYSEQIEVEPGLSVFAVTVGSMFFLSIPAIVSLVNTCVRIRKAQKLSGAQERCSVILAILCLIFGMVYVQSQLNKVWDHYGNPPEGTRIASPGHD